MSGAAAALAEAGEKPAQTTRAEQIAELRSRMAALGGEPDAPVSAPAQVLPVGEELRTLLPGGGLPRGAVSHVSDTPALVVEMIKQVAAAGGFCGVVGWGQLSYAGVPPEHLERVVAVPEPGIDPLGVAGVLAEGLDLVVVYTPQRLELSPVRARPLLARLRQGRAALVAVGTRVPSPALEVVGEVAGVHGVGHGSGRITGIDIRVRAQAKGARPASRVITLGTAPQPRPALKVVK